MGTDEALAALVRTVLSAELRAAEERLYMHLRNLVQPVRQWYSEEEVCDWKGTCYATFRREENRKYLPNGGVTTDLGPGRKRMYHIDDVLRWLNMNAEQLEVEEEKRQTAGRISA